jgi:hypothetical protein
MMMRKLLMLAVAGILVSGFAFVKAEDEGKKETITGDAVCGKCALKETKDCQNVVIVTKDGKETKYYLEKNEFFKDAHSGLKICTASKDSPIKVKVTGTVVKKDDKMTLTPTAKIEAAD